MYLWRSLSETERKEVLGHRKRNSLPWHSPPHFQSGTTDRYLLTAACYEHRSHIGTSSDRLTAFEAALVGELRPIAWAVLPNHYHALILTRDILGVLGRIGRLHGRTSHAWNTEDRSRGRKVWSGAAETAMKSERHYWATVNYIHHNPVKHGHVTRWQDWPWSSAGQFLETEGRDEARRIWRGFPVGEYGDGWDTYVDPGDTEESQHA